MAGVVTLPAGPAVLPADCGMVDVGCHIKEGAKSVVGEIVGAFADGCIEVIKYVATFWMNVPSPQIAHGGGNSWQLTPAVAEIQSYLMPIAAFLAMISYVIAIGKIAITQDVGAGTRNITRQLGTLTLSTLAIESGLQLLILAGDKFSPWIIERASGHSASEGVKQMLLAMFGTGNASSALGAFLILFILTLLASLAQAVFMVIRGAVLMVLAAFLPVAAAGTATEEGWMRFKRVAMWMVAFACYKPVAAIIFAVGIKLSQANTKGASVKGEPTLQNAIYGFTVLLLAALALPAFIKLLEPVAAMGSSNAFSGGGAAAMIGTGAAMVALSGGGAAAAGAGGSGASSAAGGSGASGATSLAGGGSAGGPSAGGGGSAGGGSGASGGGSGSSGGASSGAEGAVTPGESGGTSEEGSTAGGGAALSAGGGGEGSSSASTNVSAGGAGEGAGAGSSGAAGPSGANGADGSPGERGESGEAAPSGSSQRSGAGAGSAPVSSSRGVAGRGAAQAVRHVGQKAHEGAESVLDDAGNGAEKK